MKRAIAALMLWSGLVQADVDYTCVNDCTRQGYLYELCESRCSFDSGQRLEWPARPLFPLQRRRQTDYACVNDCTRLGYQYAFCESRCSY